MMLGTGIPHARAMKQREFNFRGAQLNGKQDARDFACVDAGPLQVGPAQVEASKIALTEIAVPQVQPVRLQAPQVESAQVTPAQIAGVTGRLLDVEFLNASFPEKEIHRFF